jgi:hypothetical protein
VPVISVFLAGFWLVGLAIALLIDQLPKELS